LNWFFGSGLTKSLSLVRKFSLLDMYWVEGGIRYHVDLVHDLAGAIFLKGRFFAVVFIVLAYLVLFFTYFLA